MTNSSGQDGPTYHERVNLTANTLADALTNQGLEASIEQAQAEAVNFNHDYRYLMGQAAGILFRTGDVVRKESGLGYLAWEAENFPDPAQGHSIAYDADYDARHPDEREFAHRCFEISLMHFSFASQKADFVPTGDFFENLNGVTSRLKDSNYPELYDQAITEFTPLAIQAATAYEPLSGDDETDWDKYHIDQMLYDTVRHYRVSDPAKAEQARSLITDETVKRSEIMSEGDSRIMDAFMADDFEAARKQLRSSDSSLIQRLWTPMYDRLQLSADEQTWGNAVLDTIVEVHPDYFVSTEDDTTVDLFKGQDVGLVIGYLGRTDIIDTLLIPELDESAGRTACAVAHGLGQRGNQIGFKHLLTRLPRYSETSINAVRISYESGLNTQSSSQ